MEQWELSTVKMGMMEQCLLRTGPKSQAEEQLWVQLLPASFGASFWAVQCGVRVPQAPKGTRAALSALSHL